MARGDVTVTHHNNDTIVLFQAAAELIQPLADMRWTLLDIEQLGFITSDQPIVHWPHIEGPAWMSV
jgi:hypothetical protein